MLTCIQKRDILTERGEKMESITSAVNVQVDSHDKDMANSILKNLGLNMSTFVNMAIKQLIYTNGLPFEVKNPKPSKELLDALQEGEQIVEDIKNGKRKGYTNMEDLMHSLDKD